MESSSLHLTIRMSSMFLICFHSIFVFSVGCLNFKKKKLCEGAYILKVIIATLYKGAKNKLTNKDSINIHQRIDASGMEWTDSIFGGTYVLPQIVLTLVLTFW